MWAVVFYNRLDFLTGKPRCFAFAPANTELPKGSAVCGLMCRGREWSEEMLLIPEGSTQAQEEDFHAVVRDAREWLKCKK